MKKCSFVALKKEAKHNSRMAYLALNLDYYVKVSRQLIFAVFVIAKI